MHAHDGRVDHLDGRIMPVAKGRSMGPGSWTHLAPLSVDILALVGEGGVARDHEAIWHVRQTAVVRSSVMASAK